MRLPFAVTDSKRERGGMPELPVINMIAEAAPSEEGGVTLQSRLPLADRSAAMGIGPVQALFQADGVLDSGLYGISTGKLYRGTTLIGVINGTGPVSMAGYENNLFIAAGQSLWAYDGTTLAAVAVPDSFDVRKVLVGASRVIVIRDDAEKFYWSNPLSSTITSLSFATSESQPDRLRDALFLDDMLILFGAETVEFWPNTGDADLPFQPLEGRVFERGIKATGCATKIQTTFAWVTNHNQICLNDENNVISSPGLEADIAASTECKLFAFFSESTEMLALRIDGATHVFNPRARTWCQFETYGLTNWAAHCFAGGVFGSVTDGRTFAFGTDYLDEAGAMERRFRAGTPINGGGFVVDNIMVRCNTGQTPYLSGGYTNPRVEMRLSRDGGRTWGEWRETRLGQQGEYRERVMWAACGMASRVGLFAEFRVTDPVDFRVSDVLVNESYGGV